MAMPTPIESPFTVESENAAVATARKAAPTPSATYDR
jgi:hypothetical protein